MNLISLIIKKISRLRLNSEGIKKELPQCMSNETEITFNRHVQSLHSAILRNQPKLVSSSLSLRKHRTILKLDEQSLDLAVRVGNKKIIEMLYTFVINNEVHISNEFSVLGITSQMLLCAFVRGLKEIIIEFLIEGGDVNAYSSNFGKTLLHFATVHGQVELVQILLKESANVNFKGRKEI